MLYWQIVIQFITILFWEKGQLKDLLVILVGGENEDNMACKGRTFFVEKPGQKCKICRTKWKNSAGKGTPSCMPLNHRPKTAILGQFQDNFRTISGQWRITVIIWPMWFMWLAMSSKYLLSWSIEWQGRGQGKDISIHNWKNYGLLIEQSAAPH